ncbi:methionyl-tRNA formyltransferase [bacterium]|nr:methionyl-tRNA formyltransferase [bacterium]
MNIVFFGSPQEAIPSLKRVLEEGHDIRLIITQPDKPSGRGRKLNPPPVKKIAAEKKLPVFQPKKTRKDPSAVQKIKSVNPDINVVVAYGQIIPGSLIYLPPYNSINLHFSLLPRYRGASPVQWALLNGEHKTGVTVFQLNEKMDEGDMLSQEEVNIHHGETAPQLKSRLAQIGAYLLVRTLSRIDQITPLPQKESQASYAPRIKKHQGQIDWNKDSHFIERQVRAMKPWPSSFTFFKQKRIKIHQGVAENRKVSSFSPGEIVEVDKTGIAVCCGDNKIYRIQELQPENKKNMSAYSFSLGSHIEKGSQFS